MADEWDLKLSDLLSNYDSRFAIVVSSFKIGEWYPYFGYLIQSHHTESFWCVFLTNSLTMNNSKMGVSAGLDLCASYIAFTHLLHLRLNCRRVVTIAQRLRKTSVGADCVISGVTVLALHQLWLKACGYQIRKNFIQGSHLNVWNKERLRGGRYRIPQFQHLLLTYKASDVPSCNSEVGHPSQLHTHFSIIGLDQELSHLANKQIASHPHCLSLFVQVSETQLRCTSYKRSKWRFPVSLSNHISLPQWNLDWCPHIPITLSHLSFGCLFIATSLAKYHLNISVRWWRVTTHTLGGISTSGPHVSRVASGNTLGESTLVSLGWCGLCSFGSMRRCINNHLALQPQWPKKLVSLWGLGSLPLSLLSHSRLSTPHASNSRIGSVSKSLQICVLGAKSCGSNRRSMIAPAPNPS